MLPLPILCLGGFAAVAAGATVTLALLPAVGGQESSELARAPGPGVRLQGLALPAMGAAVGGAVSWMLLGLPLPALLGVGAGWWAVGGVRRWQQQRERIQLRAALLSATDLLVQLLPAGHGVRQALQVLAESGPEALRPEMTRLLARSREVSLERSLQEAEQRIRQPLFTLVAATLIVGSRSGGQITPLLGELSRAAHQVEAVQGQLRAEQAQGRLGALVISLLPLALLAVLHLVNPSYLGPYATPVGQLILSALIGLVLLGYLWMLRILRLPDPDLLPFGGAPTASTGLELPASPQRLAQGRPSSLEQA